MAIKILSLHQIAVHSSNLERSIQFYRDTLGLRLIAKFDPSGLAFIDMDGVRLLFEENAPQATLYMRVDEIHAACQSLQEKGIVFVSEPHKIHRDDDGLFGPAGEEEWMAFFHDPDGNLLALVERKL